jgi:hypothetical protein
MAVNHLDDRYLSWLHAQHLAKKHRNLPGPSAPKERIEFLRRVYALPDEQRKDFLSREEAILTEGGTLSDFKWKSALLRALREEFGLAGEEEDSS